MLEPCGSADIKLRLSVLMPSTLTEMASISAESSVVSHRSLSINEALWEIEDDIRDRERAGDFGPKFIELARAVYVTNDRRAKAKRSVDEHVGSPIVEEKSYAEY